MSPDYTAQDLDALQEKPRKGGSQPLLQANREPPYLSAWITRACRPAEKAYRLQGFDRLGRDSRDPCVLIFTNGREDPRKFRVKKQSDLMRNPRLALVSLSDGWLDVPHLTPGEIEDFWTALCRFGAVLTEFDEVDQTHEWIEQMLPSCLPMNGYTLVPDGRHDALMAMRHAGQFTKADAQSMVRGAGEDQRWQQRPCRFIDSETGDQWIRQGETATYLRWVIGVEPLPHTTLRARLREIGVIGRRFEDYRPPHPKLGLYQLTESLIEGVDGAK